MTARLAVIMLCHTHLDTAAQLARKWVQGGAAVVMHVDAKAPDDEFERLQCDLTPLGRVVFSPRHRCEWGRFSLVQATLDAARMALERFDVTHVLLASGSCLPLRPASELSAFLAEHSGVDFIQSKSARDAGWVVGGLDQERFTLYFPFSWQRRRRLFDTTVALQRLMRVRRRLPRGIAPHVGSQWWCLTTPTLRAILDDRRRPELDRFFRRCWIPDESYFQTLVRRHSSRIDSRSLTLVRFDMNGRPYSLYDDHKPMLERSGCFVARKVWHGAHGLLGHFPAAQIANPAPEPAPIEQMLDQATARRRLGRAGLYMHSRFPRKDQENGKTSAPYAVFQGFCDLFPGFDGWLAGRLNVPVHGHLLAPDSVDFAGGARIGPGGLSDSPALRDHDPQGFVTSLIRSQQDMPVFQFSPRDNQSLNWFFATDPNMRLAVITGAWAIPLLRSNMPFDNVRMIAAQLQQRERSQLKILNSVWLKARVQIWDLAGFLAAPSRALAVALRQIDPGHPAVRNDLPVMRDLSGLVGFLQRLNNAGLNLDLAGNLPGELGTPGARDG